MSDELKLFVVESAGAIFTDGWLSKNWMKDWKTIINDNLPEEAKAQADIISKDVKPKTKRLYEAVINIINYFGTAIEAKRILGRDLSDISISICQDMYNIVNTLVNGTIKLDSEDPGIPIDPVGDEDLIFKHENALVKLKKKLLIKATKI